MEQTSQYLTWMRREFLLKSHRFRNVPGVSWEEKAFAEDAAGGLGGCIWPPRSYSCSFCRREFRSAQALGGHMNVHRRDRARLKQSLCSVQEQFPEDQRFCDVVVNGNNVSKVVEDHSDEKIKVDDEDVDFVETNLYVGWCTNRTGLGCGSEEAVRFSKRARTGGLNKLPPPPPPLVPGDAKVVRPFLGVEAKGLELDLELRLGDFH